MIAKGQYLAVQQTNWQYLRLIRSEGFGGEYKYQDEQAAMRCWLEANPGQLSRTTEEDGQRDGHPPCLQVILPSEKGGGKGNCFWVVRNAV